MNFIPTYNRICTIRKSDGENSIKWNGMEME